jgi:hypothetical protein
MATYQIYAANRLIGGTDGCLDYVDGAGLNDKDSAIVVHAIDNNAYFYRLDASSGATQNTPEVVAPVQNAGTKRWLLVDIVATNITPQNAISTDPNTALADNVAINEFSTDGTMAGDSDAAVPTEKAVKTYVDTTFPSAAMVTLDVIPGYLQRPEFDPSNSVDSGIYNITSGLYHLSGAEEKIVGIDNIAFTVGPGGSNGNSDALDAATTWHYIYIDDSSISAGQRDLLAENLISVKTAPTWSDAKNGWYNGNDRCIYFIYDQDGAGDLLALHNRGGRFCQMDTQSGILINVDVDDVNYTVTATVPTPVTLINAAVYTHEQGNNYTANVRFTGLASNYSDLAKAEAGTQDYVGQVINIPLDGSDQFDVRHAAAGADTMYVRQRGFYLPLGM